MKNLSLPHPKDILPFALPLLVFGVSAWIVLSGIFLRNPDVLSFAVTTNMTITAPLLYLFLIRKKKVPNTTAVPFFIGGLLLATFLLPESYHFYTDLLWKYAFPLIELSVLSMVVYKTAQVIRTFRKERGSVDFLSVFRSSAAKVLGSQRIANVLATEVAVFYYGLFSWRKSNSLPALQFSYHKENGATAVYAVIIFLLLIETAAIHFIADLWSPPLAWILTISSMYACLQLLGHLKAMRQRPVAIGRKSIHIRYGLMGDGEVPFDSIESIRFAQEVPEEKGVYHLSLLKILEPYNMEIKLKKSLSLFSMYGIRKEYHTLLLNIDKKKTFKEIIEEKL
ncbi:hypothetical protein [Nafulsella turpanensis]|uniref:hypothetical protein n=1 Tax=Nafulsella turpanensis TaxID=1265690 RepID=UPI00034AA769|nr:hypothetical protein [Nafulsella turpanensis]